jgi:hypothetical protein
MGRPTVLVAKQGDPHAVSVRAPQLGAGMRPFPADDQPHAFGQPSRRSPVSRDLPARISRCQQYHQDGSPISRTTSPNQVEKFGAVLW